MKSPTWFAMIVLAGATLACTVFVGGPTYPDSAAPEASSTQDLPSKIETAVADAAQTGVLQLDITEGQLTGYLASMLAAQVDPVISEPRVLLRDGLIEVYGKAQSGMFLATVKITAQATVDETGQPQIQVTEADFGPIPAPDALRTGISSLLHEALTGEIGPAAIGFRLESISITDGIMTLTGRIR